MHKDRTQSHGKDRQDTIPQQGERQKPSLRQPNERDESSDSQQRAEASQQRMGSVAHESMQRGQTDTDKGPVLDATYEKLREGTGRPVKQLRR